MFNTDTNRAENVSQTIAQEILRRLGLEGRGTCLLGWKASSTAMWPGSPADAAVGPNIAIGSAG